MPTYEPGLGCPHCSDAFYRPEQRAEHIQKQHPGSYSGPTEDMVMLAQRAHVSLGDIFSDRRHGTGMTMSSAPQQQAKILHMPQRQKPTVDDLYEKHLSWSQKNGHANPESVAALRAHEKSGGLTRSQANKVADQAYIGGGGSDWRSHKDDN